MRNSCEVNISEAYTEEKFDHLIKKHPCFSGEAHFKYGRIHLPVSPSCNIQCKFCKRSFNKTENRPGDTLATPNALDTFELIDSKYPQLIKCMSTNGLKLSKYAQRITKAGVKTISVTFNAVDPEILQDICSGVFISGEYLEGKEGAAQLIDAQIEGIKKISALGVVVKINTVLIPGLNFSEIRTTDPICSMGEHNEASMQQTVKLVSDCKVVLVSQIGFVAEQALMEIGIKSYLNCAISINSL